MKLLLLLLPALLCSACTKKGTEASYEVPVSACKAQYTGKEYTDLIMIPTCYGYDSKGMCTVSVPRTTYINHKEILYHCDFTRYN